MAWYKCKITDVVLVLPDDEMLRIFCQSSDQTCYIQQHIITTYIYCCFESTWFRIECLYLLEVCKFKSIPSPGIVPESTGQYAAAVYDCNLWMALLLCLEPEDKTLEVLNWFAGFHEALDAFYYIKAFGLCLLVHELYEQMHNMLRTDGDASAWRHRVVVTLLRFCFDETFIKHARSSFKISTTDITTDMQEQFDEKKSGLDLESYELMARLDRAMYKMLSILIRVKNHQK